MGRENKYSEVPYEIIRKVDRELDEQPLPIIAHDIDASISDICDAVEYLINSGWFGNSTLFAKKVNYELLIDQEKKAFKGVLLARDLEVLKNFAQNEYYTPEENFPLVIGSHDNSQQDTIILRDDNGVDFTRSKWEEKNTNKRVASIRSGYLKKQNRKK